MVEAIQLTDGSRAKFPRAVPSGDAGLLTEEHDRDGALPPVASSQARLTCGLQPPRGCTQACASAQARRTSIRPMNPAHLWRTTLGSPPARTARYRPLPGPRRRSGVWVRQAAQNQQTLIRNPAKGEQGSGTSPPSGSAKPSCVGSLARLPPRTIHSGNLLHPVSPQPPDARAGKSHRRL